MPIIGTAALFILFNNLLGLVPGFAPATDNLNITVGPALVIFFATHYYGIKENGLHYLAHFLGPKINGFPWLFWLMGPIELISHFARPLSLALRLMGNMTGDHKVLAIFLGLLYLSLPFLFLGTLVCVVQTLVFCLLSMVYIGLAIEHSAEGH
jgi:F-type H+-transporting ATPase subunit a